MGISAIKRPRGTRDFNPGEMSARRYVESILRGNANCYGYREIATPTFEHLELFTMKSGEEVVGQLYTFEDKGRRTMALRPELTAAAIRFFTEEMAYLPKPVKVFYFGNCFRYERPQKGRYREFWQFGAEVIGTSSPEAAAEIVALAYLGIRATGLKDCALRIGHIGILKGLLEKIGANDKPIMTLIDKGNIDGLSEYFEEKRIQGFDFLRDILALKGDPNALEKGWDILTAALAIGKDERDPENDRVSESSGPDWTERIREGFDCLTKISGFLRESGIEYIIDFGIARGLDYYTGMVFEIDVHSLGAEKQICGGGEYNLNEIFSIDIKGTSGFAIGFDRLLMALRQEGVTFDLPVSKVGIISTPGSELTSKAAFSLAIDFRIAGFPTELEVMGRGLKKALSRMNELKVPIAIIVGERELDHGNVILREMNTGEQQEVSRESIIDRVKEMIMRM